MSEHHNKKSNDTKQRKSCDAIDEVQPDHFGNEEISSPIREKDDGGHSSEPENESEDVCADANRNSQCSYGTENSILSTHVSLQVLETDDYDTLTPEEICVNEGDPSNGVETAENIGGLREFDLRCNSPLLNGHTTDNEPEITTEKPQEANLQRNSDASKIVRRVISFFEKRRLRTRTAPVHFSRSNGDAVITVDEEGSNFLDTRQPKTKSPSSFNMRIKGWLQPMDNKMNMKVFGSRKAMAEEVLRYKKAGWIIHPTSALRFEIIPSLLRKKRYEPCVKAHVFSISLFTNSKIISQCF